MKTKIAIGVALTALLCAIGFVQHKNRRQPY